MAGAYPGAAGAERSHSAAAWGGARRLSDWAQMLGNNTREIEEIDVALGHWLAANTPPDSLIALDDIGAITYISGRRILDMNGLVSPEVWPALAVEEGLTARSGADAHPLPR